jgi:benzoylformate decarboxylase
MSDLIAAIKAIVPAHRLKAMANERTGRARSHWEAMASFRRSIVKAASAGPQISLPWLAAQLEAALHKDSYYVADVDSGKTMDPFMSFGGSDKTYLTTSPAAFGWGMAAALGVKLARPDRPVVCVLGDGSFLFSGPMPLWSMARYKAPITTIVLNNRSYNGERNRIWMNGGTQFQTGRDMTCYLGDPDVDYARMAQSFSVEAETVETQAQLKPAMARAKRATLEGRPYLLDVIVQREGRGSASMWHPEYRIADKRARSV